MELSSVLESESERDKSFYPFLGFIYLNIQMSIFFLSTMLCQKNKKKRKVSEGREMPLRSIISHSVPNK